MRSVGHVVIFLVVVYLPAYMSSRYHVLSPFVVFFCVMTMYTRLEMYRRLHVMSRWSVRGNMGIGPAAEFESEFSVFTVGPGCQPCI